MKKMPAILPGYTWDVDRTSDVITVRVLHKEVTVGFHCLAVRPGLGIRLRLAFLHALWDEFVWGPIFSAINAVKEWEDARAEAQWLARAQANQDLAASLDGQWDWRGRPITSNN